MRDQGVCFVVVAVQVAKLLDAVDGDQVGADGARGRVRLDDGTPFSAKGKQTVAAGRRLILKLPGGGGFGDPAERDPAAIANDTAQGYVT